MHKKKSLKIVLSLLALLVCVPVSAMDKFADFAYNMRNYMYNSTGLNNVFYYADKAGSTAPLLVYEALPLVLYAACYGNVTDKLNQKRKVDSRNDRIIDPAKRIQKYDYEHIGVQRRSLQKVQSAASTLLAEKLVDTGAKYVVNSTLPNKLHIHSNCGTPDEGYFTWHKETLDKALTSGHVDRSLKYVGKQLQKTSLHTVTDKIPSGIKVALGTPMSKILTTAVSMPLSGFKIKHNDPNNLLLLNAVELYMHSMQLFVDPENKRAQQSFARIERTAAICPYVNGARVALGMPLAPNTITTQIGIPLVVGPCTHLAMDKIGDTEFGKKIAAKVPKPIRDIGKDVVVQAAIVGAQEAYNNDGCVIL